MKKFGLIACLITGLFACKPEGSDPDQVPNVPVNITINTSLPLYYGVQTIGNFIYLDGGYKGVYLFHNYNDEYIAFDRSCTYKPQEPCAIVSVDSSDLTLKCACCPSQFTMEGILKQTPAQRSLKQYNVYKSGDLLNITN